MPIFLRYGFGLLALLGSCATPRALAPGSYLETRPHTALFTSRQLVVYPAGRVRYLVHTDVVGTGREGHGTYRWRGRRLELRLTGPPDTARAQVVSQALPDAERRLRFFVTTPAEAGQAAPLLGATVLARTAAGGTVAAAATDAEGYAELPALLPEKPHHLEVVGIGWRSWQGPWPAGPTSFRLRLVPLPGQPYPAGTRKTFVVVSATPERLVLLQGTDTLTMVRQ